MKKHGIILLLLRVLVGGVFLYAGAVKAADPLGLFNAILRYDIITYRPLVAGFAFYLPWLEIVSGAALAFWNVRGAAVLLFGLTSVFFVAIASAIVRGLNIACGCFGGASLPMKVELGIDLVILAALGVLLWCGRCGLRAQQGG